MLRYYECPSKDNNKFSTRKEELDNKIQKFYCDFEITKNSDIIKHIEYGRGFNQKHVQSSFDNVKVAYISKKKIKETARPNSYKGKNQEVLTQIENSIILTLIPNDIDSIKRDLDRNSNVYLGPQVNKYLKYHLAVKYEDKRITSYAVNRKFETKYVYLCGFLQTVEKTSFKFIITHIEGNHEFFPDEVNLSQIRKKNKETYEKKLKEKNHQRKINERLEKKTEEDFPALLSTKK